MNIARQGRNGWKRYVLGILIVFGVTLCIMTLILIITAHILGIAVDNTDVVLYGNPIRTIVLEGLSTTALLLGLFLAVKLVHKRKFMTLISPDATVDWVRVIKSFIVWLGLRGISFLVLYLIFPSHFSLTFNMSEWLPFALLALVVSPIFALSQALLLYAYPIQGLGLLSQNPLFLSISWGFIIGTISVVGEATRYWIFYIVYSAFITWIAIKDNRLELAIGLLIADFLYSHLFIGLYDSVIQAPTVFKYADSAFSLLPILAVYVFRASLFYFICFGRRRNLSTSTPD